MPIMGQRNRTRKTPPKNAAMPRMRSRRLKNRAVRDAPIVSVRPVRKRTSPSAISVASKRNMTPRKRKVNPRNIRPVPASAVRKRGGKRENSARTIWGVNIPTCLFWYCRRPSLRPLDVTIRCASTALLRNLGPLHALVLWPRLVSLCAVASSVPSPTTSLGGKDFDFRGAPSPTALCSPSCSPSVQVRRK